MKQVGTKKSAKDTRLWSDEVRLHPWLGLMLAQASYDLRCAAKEFRFRNVEFNRAAIPILHTGRLIVRVDPNEGLPTWLENREVKLAMRRPNVPIWMPDRRQYASYAKDQINPIDECLEASLLIIQAAILESRRLN